MDRFIERKPQQEHQSNPYLKSSMDRFIDKKN